ncbi:C1 family peptidase [Bdellovibrio bacteriovorus]|nr:C1 family peptidase [Bdellovibrio bacteriovorus]
MKFLFPLLFVFSLWSLPIQAGGAPLCADVFQFQAFQNQAPAEVIWGTLRADFKHHTRYTVDLKQSTQIKNQCNLGTCHLHSWMSHLERGYEQKTGQSLTLSNEYLSARHWLERSLLRLEKPSKEVEVKLGAGPLFSRESILEYGLIPEGAWKPKSDFMLNPQAKKMSEFIENILVRTQWQAEKTAEGPAREAVLEQGRNQIKDLFRQMVGEVPAQFEFQGQTWTPKDFAKAYFESFEGPMTQMAIHNDRKAATKFEKTPQGRKLITSLDKVEDTARRMLDKGEAVYLSYDHHAEYVDASSGIMSIRAFHIPTYARPATRQMREAFDTNSGGHAVQIVGYELDPRTGRVVKWKIRNSWGTKKGDEGHYHMYDDYFRAFAKSITVPSAFLPFIPM